MISLALFLSSWSVFFLISIYCDEVSRPWYQVFFLILIGSLCIKGMWGRGGVSFITERRQYLYSRCVLTHCQVAWSGTMRVASLPVCLFYFILLFVPFLPLTFLFLPSLPLLPVRNLLVRLMSHVFFFLPVQKRKMIQTMKMSAYHLLVAISSRLPQSQIGPQIKYKTETHAFCIWMLIPCLEIPNCFWQGICRGPSFMYILRFMKHMIKVDI